MSSFVSTKQLFDMKNVLLNQGVSCVYLSENARISDYHFKIMLWLFRYDDCDIQGHWITYPNSRVFFRSACNRPDSLKGYRCRIIPDHNAFRDENRDEQEFRDLIFHSRRYEHL